MPFCACATAHLSGLAALTLRIYWRGWTGDARRRKVLELFGSGTTATPQDSFNAALVLQHTGLVSCDGKIKGLMRKIIYSLISCLSGLSQEESRGRTTLSPPRSTATQRARASRLSLDCLTIRSSRDRFSVSGVIQSPAAARLKSGVRMTALGRKRSFTRIYVLKGSPSG